MTTIEVVKEEEGRLKRTVWSFYWYDFRLALVVDTYSEEERASTRHKYRPVRLYKRLDSHRRSYGDYHIVEEKDVPLPDEVKNEALDKFKSQLTVGMWEEGKGR